MSPAVQPKITEKSKDGSFSLQLHIPQSEIQNQATKQIEIFRQKFSAHGFRPGKAPLDLVKSHYPTDHIIEDIFPKLVSQVYSLEIQRLGLHPIVPPKVEIISKPLSLEHDWEVKLTSCQLPTLTLAANLKEQIKKLNSHKPKTEDKNTHLNHIIDTIVKSANLELSPVLLEHELEHRLGQLVDQLNQAGLTVNQYLASKNKSGKNGASIWLLTPWPTKKSSTRPHKMSTP